MITKWWQAKAHMFYLAAVSKKVSGRWSGWLPWGVEEAQLSQQWVRGAHRQSTILQCEIHTSGVWSKRAMPGTRVERTRTIRSPATARSHTGGCEERDWAMAACMFVFMFMFVCICVCMCVDVKEQYMHNCPLWVEVPSAQITRFSQHGWLIYFWLSYDLIFFFTLPGLPLFYYLGNTFVLSAVFSPFTWYFAFKVI